MAEDDVHERALSILMIRGLAVVLDRDLAALYGVKTKVFNRAVTRNQSRFPKDFGFQLTRKEFVNLRCQIGTSSLHGGWRYLPSVFTEHGAIMAAGILNSPRAVAMSVSVVRAFVSMRREMASHADLERRMDAAEKILINHDDALRDVYRKLRPLILAPVRHARKTGFVPPDSGKGPLQ